MILVLPSFAEMESAGTSAVEVPSFRPPTITSLTRGSKQSVRHPAHALGESTIPCARSVLISDLIAPFRSSGLPSRPSCFSHEKIANHRVSCVVVCSDLERKSATPHRRDTAVNAVFTSSFCVPYNPSTSMKLPTTEKDITCKKSVAMSWTALKPRCIRDALSVSSRPGDFSSISAFGTCTSLPFSTAIPKTATIFSQASSPCTSSPLVSKITLSFSITPTRVS
mmetsp:Transcript_20709/g.84133  ORF Transcript_20709/g.84133 Transcript_20709/m.84133 type:complete len:224 (-) Transcript_20709:2588-3259(-)